MAQHADHINNANTNPPSKYQLKPSRFSKQKCSVFTKHEDEDYIAQTRLQTVKQEHENCITNDCSSHYYSRFITLHMAVHNLHFWPKRSFSQKRYTFRTKHALIHGTLCKYALRVLQNEISIEPKNNTNSFTKSNPFLLSLRNFLAATILCSLPNHHFQHLKISQIQNSYNLILILPLFFCFLKDWQQLFFSQHPSTMNTKFHNFNENTYFKKKKKIKRITKSVHFID